MNTMKKILCLVLALVCSAGAWAQGSYKELYKLPSTESHYISPTRYDYGPLASSLVEGCNTDFEKIEAIYDWMTRTIAYDTSYTNHTADECYREKKGVCQGYCELFYRLADAVGLRVEIISGISRDIYGNVKNSGHAWIFAYTHGNYGLLMDPTWDAGTVNGGVFTRNTFHRAWFGVDPKWMILTHFPKNAVDQILPDPLSEEEFRSLNYGFSLQYIYGFDVNEMYTRARAHTLSMPKIYSGGVGEFTLIDAPLQKELHVGHQYKFRVRMLKDRDLILTRNGTWFSSAKGQWMDEGNGVYSFICVPEYPGEVRLNLRDKSSDGVADTVILYTVPEPTEEEKRLLSSNSR